MVWSGEGKAPGGSYQWMQTEMQDKKKRVVKHGNRLPRAVVESLPSELFTTRLNMILSNLPYVTLL